MAYGQLELVGKNCASIDLSDPTESGKLTTKLFGSNTAASKIVKAVAGATTLDLSYMFDDTSSNQLCLVNLDDTEAVVVTWDDQVPNSNTTTVPKGAMLVLPNVKGSVAVTLTGADVYMKLFALSEA